MSTTVDTSQVAAGVGALGDRTIRPLAFGGHCFYVRKCVTGQPLSADFWDRHEGGIALPQSAIEQCNRAEVLAIGPNVGRSCSKSHAKQHRRARCAFDMRQVEVGDVVWLPDEHPGMRWRDLADFEGFVEESVPFAIEKANHG